MKSIASLCVAVIAFSAGFVIAGQQQTLELTGAKETPAVETKASGVATLSVEDDGAVSGGIKTTGIQGTAAHIHMGDVGASGPPIITLERAGADQWMVPQGAKLSTAQYAAFKKGGLYVNVHSKAHPGGEIRAQLEAGM